MAMRAMIIPRTVPMNSRFDVKMAENTSLAALGAEEDGPDDVVAPEEILRRAFETD